MGRKYRRAYLRPAIYGRNPFTNSSRYYQELSFTTSSIIICQSSLSVCYNTLLVCRLFWVGDDAVVFPFFHSVRLIKIP
jgi:hypothetical protein